MRRTLFGLAGSLLISAAAHAACALGAVAVLPTHMVGGHFVFPVDVNGHPANLALDTGAFSTTFWLSSAEQLGISMRGTDTETSGVGGVRQIYRGTAKRFRIGSLDADNMEVAAAVSEVGARGWGADGVLGMNMMAAYDVDLDTPGQHVIIFEADGDCRKPNVALSPPLYSVALENVQNNRQAVVELTIEGQRFRALLDTGAPGTVMYRHAANRLGMDLSGLRAPGHHVVRGIGPFGVAAMTHVFEHVSIGSLTVNNMQVEIVDQVERKRVHTGSLLTDPTDEEGGGQDMLLGADFLQKVHVWLSHSSHRLIMQYPPRESVLPK